MAGYILCRGKQGHPINFYSTGKKYGLSMGIKECADKAIQDHVGAKYDGDFGDLGPITEGEVFGMSWENYGGGIRIFACHNGKAVDMKFVSQ